METSVDFALPDNLRAAIQYALSHSDSESGWSIVWKVLLDYACNKVHSSKPTKRLEFELAPQDDVLLRALTSQQVLPLASVTKFDSSRLSVEPELTSGSEYESGQSGTQSSHHSGSPSQILDALLVHGVQNLQMSNQPLGGNLSYPSLTSLSGSTANTQYGLNQPSTAAMPLKRGSDERRSIDIGLMKLYSSGEPACEIHGYMINSYRAHVPLLLQLKPAPSSDMPIPRCPKFISNPTLTEKMREAYEGFCEQLPHAFVSHPSQESIITLAVSGLWWSFAVVTRGDRDIKWSDCFTVGYPSHDQVLFCLVRGASISPSHPGSDTRVKALVETHIISPEDPGSIPSPDPCEGDNILVPVV